MRSVTSALVGGLGALLLLAASYSASAEQGAELALRSGAFAEYGPIPARYTCDGEDISPPLTWSSAPRSAKSLVLIVDDPDAPNPAAPQMTWIHWVLYDIPPSAKGLPEGVKVLPAGTQVALNSWHRKGYGGPCPPIGRHRYFFKLYALNAALGKLDPADKGSVEKAMRGHVIGQAQLVGTYQRQRR